MKKQLRKIFTAMCVFGALVSANAADTYNWQVTSVISFVYSGDSVFTIGATADALNLNLNQCSGGIQKPHAGTTNTLTWYKNTTNSTTGGTVVSSTVYSTPFAFTAATSFVPPTDVAGTFYYYGVFSNTQGVPNGETPCGFSGTLVTPTLKVVVAAVVSSEYLSYHGSSAGAGGTNQTVELRNLSTCQAKVEASLYNDIYTGVWTGQGNYDYYVNGNLVGSSTTASQTVDLSSYIPVTSVKIVSKASTWSVVDLVVKVYGQNDPTVAPTVVTPVVYEIGDVATVLSATLTANGTSLKWFTTVAGDGNTATAPTPSTAAIDTVSYWVSEVNANGCESKRAEIEVIVKPKGLSYHGSRADAGGTRPSVELTNFSTCQSKVVASLYNDIYTGVWTGQGNYDYYVNGNLVGSSTTASQTVDLSSYIPVTSVKIVSKASTWSVVDLVVKVYNQTNPSVAPAVTTPVVYTKDDVATALTATMTGTGSSLKWFTSVAGDGNSATAPTPSTAAIDTISYWVSEANANGCESLRAKIEVIVEDKVTGLFNANENSLVIYPNPVKNNFSVTNYKEGDVVIVRDMMGKTQVSQAITPSIEMSNLNNGVFIYEVIRDGETIQQGKIIKN